MSEPKITKQDVLNASSEMLNKDLYVVFTKPINGMIPVMENLEDHLKFQVSLEKQGIMFGAGPFWEDNEIMENKPWYDFDEIARHNTTQLKNVLLMKRANKEKGIMGEFYEITTDEALDRFEIDLENDDLKSLLVTLSINKMKIDNPNYSTLKKLVE